jgi:adenosylcobinamide kinase/adenosylcobinamide-phosphate guanylyltransferase
VQVLGSGAADGWPNPFCRCGSCGEQRRLGVLRGPTAALLDGHVLLDCGAATVQAAARLGVALDAVDTILVTHAHPDHCSPEVLLWQAWARPPRPLTLAGPPSVLDAVAPWLGPGSEVRTVALHPGDVVRLGDIVVRPVRAAHEVETVLLDVETRAGHRLLYATDTGPLPPDALSALAGRAYDLVLLEETFGHHTAHGTLHHDLTAFAATLSTLRASGAVTAATDVRAVHLGHHNPPEPALAAALATLGAAPARDGQRLTLGQPAPPQRLLVLGGARSGKSHHAEQLLAAEPAVTYVATGGARPDDPDWLARVAEHRARRPPGWSTVESLAVEKLLRSPGGPVLVDCLSLWLTGVLDEADAWDEDQWPAARPLVRARVDALAAAVRGSVRPVVLVSNEVGAGVVPATWSGRVFRDELGRLNAAVAAACDDVHLVVAGIALPLAGRPVPPVVGRVPSMEGGAG